VACQGEPAKNDADVIVVGAGIAGISAALEAAAAGARVLVIETSSVPGGHAVRAGGFALVGTPLQVRKGLTDTPDIAYQDLMAWGEDADPGWVRAYVENSRTEVYDWLISLGVKFAVVLDTPEDSVPRFHFARGGTAVHAVVPMLRAAYRNANIRFVMNSGAERLVRSGQAVTGIEIRNSRSGARTILRAPSVVLATGGFQSNLDMVRANWRTGGPNAAPEPTQLLIGAGHEATGTGIKLAKEAGAALSRMDHQVIFVNGLTDPRKRTHGLNTQNPAAIWVNADGRRFVNELANTKTVEAAALALSPQTHWLIFDAQGRRRLRIRDTIWLNPKTIVREILDNPAVVHKAETIDELAAAAELPAGTLRNTIEHYNAAVASGEDFEFRRFAIDSPGPKPIAIDQPPFYAMQLFPMTRKSMGGLAIDATARVLDQAGIPIPGLYAAGELTGVAGINGSHGGSGTFLGPCVFTGRIAGRSAVPDVRDTAEFDADTKIGPAAGQMLGVEQLAALLEQPRPGYWHFEQAHATVLERSDACERCHSSAWPTAPATGAAQTLAQLDSCTECH